MIRGQNSILGPYHGLGRHERVVMKLDQRCLVVAGTASAAKHETRRMIVDDRLEPVPRVANGRQPRGSLRRIHHWRRRRRNEMRMNRGSRQRKTRERQGERKKKENDGIKRIISQEHDTRKVFVILGLRALQPQHKFSTLQRCSL